MITVKGDHLCDKGVGQIKENVVRDFQVPVRMTLAKKPTQGGRPCRDHIQWIGTASIGAIHPPKKIDPDLFLSKKKIRD